MSVTTTATPTEAPTTTSLVFGIRLSPSSFQRVKVDGVNLDDTVDQLKELASKTTSFPKSLLELVYSGNILDEQLSLKGNGLKPGVMVHVLKKKEKEPPPPPKTMTESEIQDLVLAFRTFTRHPSYRNALQRLSRPEVLDCIISTTPGLKENPIAMSILQDPELLVFMENVETVRRVAERFPPLAEAANHIAAAVHEEAAGSSGNAAGTSGYGYSLEALSDEDEMDSSQSSDSQTRISEPAFSQPTFSQPSFSQAGYSGITAQQLAAALATATASPRPSTSGMSGSANSMITSEMFSQAIQQAIANVGAGPNAIPSTSTAGTSESTSNEVEALSRRLSRQLQQMREMGLTDNAVNLQALQATGGDVHAAIDLVFSGALTPDAH